LPVWVQFISWSLPPSYVFEGMRAVMIDHVVRLDLLAAAFGLNIIYFSAASWWFLNCLKEARREGRLLQVGE